MNARPTEGDGMSESERLQIRCNREAIGEFADTLQAWCESHAVPQRVLMAFQVAFDELLTNLVDYAFEDAAARAGARIEVDLCLEPGVLHALLIDNGPAFNPLQRQAPDTHVALEDREIGGLGIHLVRELMDDLQWRRENDLNHLELRKHFDAAPPSHTSGTSDA